MGVTEILVALTKIFIMIIPGLILKKLAVVNEEQTRGVSAIITQVTYPCLVITAMQMPFSLEILNNCKYVALIYLGIIVAAFLCSKLVEKLVKLPHSQAGIMTFMLIFGNTGFIGLPVLNGLFGSEAVFYGAICDLTCDVFMFTFGIAIIRSAANSGKESKPSKKQVLKDIFNPCVFGVIIGFVLFMTNITLPEIIGGSVKVIGDATTPLAMFVVGSQLAELKFKELISNKYIYLMCGLKLLLVPAVALLLVRLFFGSDSLLATVIVLEAAMPVAMSAVIFSQQYKGDVDFATKGVLLSTLLCIITIPLFAVLLTAI